MILTSRAKSLVPLIAALLISSQGTAAALGQQCIGCDVRDPGPVAVRNHLPASALLLEAPATLVLPHPAVATRTSAPSPPQAAPAPGGAVSGFGIWDCIAAHESGGNWRDASGGYEGGLQFLNSTWLAAGGGRFARHAYDATPAQQVEIARSWLARTSWSQWPNTSRACGV